MTTPVPPVGGPAVADDILVARAYLLRVAEAGSLPVARFVVENGPVEAARLIRSADVPESVAAATQARRLDADGGADLDAAGRQGIAFVVPESPEWPHFALAGLYAAQQRRLAEPASAARYGGEPTVPLGLWIRGALPLASVGVHGVALVGARAATQYGEHVALEFAYGLAAADVCVVSGGAFGIDVNAHRGALAAGGSSILVSAAGLDRPYPRAHAGLYEEVAAGGLLISESPPGCAPHRHRFLSRNRIIAALSSGTVVVEAAARSGALNTAAHAFAIGRPVMAVPGPVTSAMSAGCHALLGRTENPAVLVSSVEEIISVVGTPNGGKFISSSHNRVEVERGGYSGEGVSISAREERAERPRDALDVEHRTVLEGFPSRGWVGLDQIARRSGVAPVVVMRSLPALELAGFIEGGRDGFRLAADRRG